MSPSEVLQVYIQAVIRKWTKLTSSPIPPLILTILYPGQTYFYKILSLIYSIASEDIKQKDRIQ